MESKRQVLRGRILQLPPRRKPLLERGKIACETTRFPSPASKVLTRNGGTKCSNGGTRRGPSPSGRKFQKPCQKVFLRDLHESIRVTNGVLPSVKCTEPKKKAAVMAGDVLFCIQRRANCHAKDRTRMERLGKNILAMVRNVKKLGCVSQNVDSRSKNSVISIQKKHRISSRSELRRWRTPVAERSIKIREKKGTSLALMQSEVSSFQKFDHRCQKKTKKQERWARREAWDWATRGHVFSRLRWIGFLLYLAIHSQTGGKRSCRGLQCVNARIEQRRFELSRLGNSTSVKATNDCHYSRWCQSTQTRKQQCTSVLELHTSVLFLFWAVPQWSQFL